MSFIKGKQSMDWGSTVPKKQRRTLPEGFWARASFIEHYERYCVTA